MLVALIVAVVLILFAVTVYNRLVAMRERVRSAWAQIDVRLKRRYDLIPNLVETVKGYAGHERQTLEAVVAARNQAAGVAGSGDPAQRAAAENQLSGAVRQLFAVAEAYPDLKANQNFMALQRELSETENGIGQERQVYNALVAGYNTSVLSFPSNLMAGPFGFSPQPFFEVHDAAQREAPAVRF